MTASLSRRVGILLVIVVTLLIGSRVFAQGNSPWGQVNAKLDQILAALSPAAPQPGPVTLKMATLLKGSNAAMYCILTNLGTETLIDYSIKVLDGLGAVMAQSGVGATLGPGEVHRVGGNLEAVQLHPRCEFSFVGLAKDVRGTGLVAEILDNFGDGTALGVLEAR